ncbi:hypothetical protein [Cryptosporangium phraense]|uniref:Uncharacterized protein n=1 Tax=Cryptosporangium phraense TaxID=2593070 RepID=A0A545ANK1_9ACTN|nr:hypothetical protein [Cryptosporangium phraense]TQS42315.1 hypothetical protein FL583_25670 [Cryptosporangium phraense]
MPAQVVPPRPRPIPVAAARTPSSNRVTRRIAAGALLAAVFVGGTAGSALADVRSVQLPMIHTDGMLPAVATDVARNVGTMVVTWPSASTKSTAAPLGDPDQGVVRRQGTATRLAVVWAAAATVAMAGILAGSLYRRRELRLALSRPAPVRLDAWRRQHG